MNNPRLVAFDLDGTLTPSKQPMTAIMAQTMQELLNHLPVCVISGGMFEQFDIQFLTPLQATTSQAQNLHLMPTCGTHYLTWDDNDWKTHYYTEIPADQRKNTIQLIEKIARQQGIWQDHTWGEAIEDRGSQITYSALGQQAPAQEKDTWDPTGKLRNHLAEELQPYLKNLQVRCGGSTSVDVTLKGVDKAYGMRELMQRLDLKPTDIIFYGDRLDPSGNDYPVKSTGIRCISVSNWEETNDYVQALLSA